MEPGADRHVGSANRSDLPVGAQLTVMTHVWARYLIRWPTGLDGEAPRRCWEKPDRAVLDCCEPREPPGLYPAVAHGGSAPCSTPGVQILLTVCPRARPCWRLLRADVVWYAQWTLPKHQP